MAEKIFEHINHKDNTPIDESIKQCWYQARAYVVDQLPIWESKFGIHKNSDSQLRFVFRETSPLTMSVARHIAFIAHYANFKESDGSNATEIYIVRPKKEHSMIEKDYLYAEEYMGNLYRFCHENYVDVKLYLQAEKPSGDIINITEEDIISYVASHPECTEGIDTLSAQYVNLVYNIGQDIDNLPPDDPNTAERYNLAIDVFCYHKDKKRLLQWNKSAQPDNNGRVNQYEIRNKVSNIFCSDCFASRMHGVIEGLDKDKYPKFDGDIIKYLKKHTSIVQKAIADNLETIARCEHARWIVEKLLLGFEPILDMKDRKLKYEDEEMFGKEQSSNRNFLKKNFKHIDLCSYSELKRVSPEDMKYDCFLMLAIPHILLKVYGSNRKKSFFTL